MLRQLAQLWKRLTTDPPAPAPAADPLVRRQRDLAAWLDAVETAGFVLGPDRHLRIQRLLALLPPDQSLTDLRDYLTPLLATDPQEQARLHALFDALAAESESKPERSLEKPELPGGKPPAASLPPPRPDTPAAPSAFKPERGPRRFVADLERCVSPPYVWNFAVAGDENDPDDLSIAPGEALGPELIRPLRARERTDTRALDLGATARATAARGGLPALRYRHRTRPSEFLLLVERLSPNDHRARLFDHLYHTLRGNDVHIERFFYDGDLRLCRNEQWPAGLSLRDLRYRFADARLLVLGAGYRLLDPATGRITDWAAALPAWRLRALLTPVPRADWGRHERRLAQILTLLPAATESIRFLAEAAPDTFGTVPYLDLPDAVQQAAERPPIPTGDPLPYHLAQHFDTDMLRWIAACAVWPALHFELTLRIGRWLSPPERNLVTLPNLLALARLPWFVQGFMPAPARQALVEYLEHRHPEARARVTERLHQLLEHRLTEVPPPTDSAAWAEHQLHLALLDALRNPNPDPETLEQLRTVVRPLDGEQQSWDFVLPAGLEQVLEKLGHSVPPDDAPMPTTAPLKTVLIYAHEDSPAVELLRLHLVPLEQSKSIELWYDGKILPGQKWDDVTKHHLEQAELILLCISADLIASNYFETIKLQQALQRHRDGQTLLVPIILRHCDWAQHPQIGQLQALPPEARPVYSKYYSHPDVAFVEILQAIKILVANLLQKRETRLHTEAKKNRIPIPEMVPVQGGVFEMGSPGDDTEAYDDERPLHKVAVQDFSIGKFPVTVAQFAAFVRDSGYRTEAERGDGSYIWTGSKYEKKSGVKWDCDVAGKPRTEADYEHPVIHVSWNDAVAYAAWLSQKTGQTYRLPTEAEWEYAAQGGHHARLTPWPTEAPKNIHGSEAMSFPSRRIRPDQREKYAGSDNLDEVAWYSANSGGATHPVGQKQANALGLYDMSGNVWEWCADWYGDKYYAKCAEKGLIIKPQGPEKGGGRVLRGGSWVYGARGCRPACRAHRTPTSRYSNVGIRLVCPSQSVGLPDPAFL